MNKNLFAPGNIIQITDEKHPWYPALLIVDEMNPWGVLAYAIIPTNDGSEPPALAYNRLLFGQIDHVGIAAICTAYDREDDDHDQEK